MREAVKHDKFNEIIATKHADIPPTEKQPEKRPLNNSNRMIFSGDSYYYEDLVGGKTGYTDTSRHTLVSLAKKDGVNLIAVIMKAEKNAPYTESAALYEYGFSLYHDVKALNKNEYATDFTVYADDNTMRVIELVPREDITVSLPETVDQSKIQKEPVYDTSTRFDLKEGDIYGTLDLLYEGIPIAQTDLIVAGITTKPVPHAQVEEDADSKEVFNITDESAMARAGVFGNPLPAIAIIALLSAASIFAFRAYRLHKKRMSRRRLRVIGGRSYRYRNDLSKR
jgi:D-alanyl-D-alanine carboxypeptidase